MAIKPVESDINTGNDKNVAINVKKITAIHVDIITYICQPRMD